MGQAQIFNDAIWASPLWGKFSCKILGSLGQGMGFQPDPVFRFVADMSPALIVTLSVFILPVPDLSQEEHGYSSELVGPRIRAPENSKMQLWSDVGPPSSGLTTHRRVQKGLVQCDLGGSRGRGPRRPKPPDSDVRWGHGMLPRLGGGNLSWCRRLSGTGER